jgi:hypothetical protein
MEKNFAKTNIKLTRVIKLETLNHFNRVHKNSRSLIASLAIAKRAENEQSSQEDE